MRFIAILMLLWGCVTVRENIVYPADNDEYGVLIEMLYFKTDTVYYDMHWRYIEGDWIRIWRDGSTEQWRDTIAVYLIKEKEL